jgi:hypothetical protein
MNRIVAHFQDGQLLKGFTTDFLPAKDHFHITGEGEPAGSKPRDVKVAELKALFFVKTFAGNPEHKDLTDAAAAGASQGRRIRVVFKDGETIVGTTQGYDRSRPGFFVVPVDADSNNERCFVVAAATQEVSFL